MVRSIHAAAEAGDTALLEQLLNAGADMHAVDRRVAGTPSTRSGRAAALQLLLDWGADVEAAAADGNGHRALNHAAAHDHTAALQLLLERSANVDGSYSKGWQALHDAAIAGHTAAV